MDAFANVCLDGMDVLPRWCAFPQVTLLPGNQSIINQSISFYFAQYKERGHQIEDNDASLSDSGKVRQKMQAEFRKNSSQ